jgi:glycosyltransferase involved in cell wall biosynthesis
MSVRTARSERTNQGVSQSSKTIDLSVIVPAYREGRLIYGNLRRLVGELDKLNVTYEVIVVSDGNTDKTVAEAQRLGSSAVKVFHYPMNVGRGFALSFGVSQSTGTLVTFIDADMKVDPANISNFIHLMQGNPCDAVVGSKRHPESRVLYPVLRKAQSAMYQLLIRALFDLNVRDTLTGLALFRRNVLEDVLPLLTVKKFAFDLELLVVARFLGYRKILEAPIRLDAKFDRTIDPRVISRILRDTIAIFYRLRITKYYALQRRLLTGSRPIETPLGGGPVPPHRSLRILILNWRCPRNPRAGGAEALTFGVARRLVQQGDTVEWYSASFQGAPSHETLEGVQIIRGGRPWTVHWRAFRRYRDRLPQDFDIVVDEVNAIPFFAPLWSKAPVIMLIHQLIREIWWYEAKFPLSVIGFLCEPSYLRLYRNVPVMTVSTSTRDDLRRLGLNGSITIIPEGVEGSSDLSVVKAQAPRFLYVGRLVPSKRVGDVIRAFAMFYSAAEPAELCLCGTGSQEYIGALRDLVRRLGLSASVRFTGRVSSQEKHREMAEAHMLLVTSAREGWGLVVTEANAFGTPAVAYDVPGLRDSIQHHETGLLVPASPAVLAEAMIRLWQDRHLYQQLSSAAIAASTVFSFEETARAFRTELTAALARTKSRQMEVASRRISAGHG